MSKQTYRERWRREVFRTPLLSDSVRVALLALAEQMDDEGMVSLKRDDLAGMIGKSGRRVGDRLTAAIGKGFLERVARGQRNGAGRFQATLPADPSSGRYGVPKTPGLLRTPCRPEEKSLGDGFQPEENSALEDGMVSRREQNGHVVLRTPCRPEETVPSIGTAHARSRGTHLSHDNPATAVTEETAPPVTTTKVSQSARKRGAFRWLHEKYRLTEFEAAAVVAEVTARAPKEIRALVPYLAGMNEGDLADIVTAVFDRTGPEAEPANGDQESGRPLVALSDWCGSCNEQTRLLDLLDGRVRRCPACHPLRDQETA